MAAPLTISREARRLAAAADLHAGMTPAEVARKHNVSRTNACKWNRMLLAGKSLEAIPRSGRPRKVDWDALRIIYGSRSVWTGPGFSDTIYRVTGQFYSDDHAGRLLNRLRTREATA